MGPSFVIIGAGTVGRAFGKLLREKGYRFLGAASRTMDSAQAACDFVGTGKPTTEPLQLTPQAELVLLTTPDGEIRSVAAALGRGRALRSGSVVAHCSGALPSTVLADARACGARIGSLHPLQTFSTPEQAIARLPGSYCCIEGDPAAVDALETAARTLQMQTLHVLPEQKPLYHAAAVVACNYLVALQEAALKLAQAAQIDRAEALQAFLPLIEGTVANLRELGIPHCLTGPIARGDIETVERHLHAIEQAAPDVLPLYRVLGREAVEVALAKGTITGDTGMELLQILSETPQGNVETG